MSKKILFYLEHITLMLCKNSSRFVLTIIGLTVGLFLFSTGNILINSYFNQSLDEVNEMDDSMLILKTETQDRMLLDKLQKIDEGNRLDVSGVGRKSMICLNEYEDGRMLAVFANILGVSNMKNGLLPVVSSEEEYIAKNTKLIAGRLINANDVANRNHVVVIDEFTARLLFGESNPIGKVIRLGLESDSESPLDIGDETASNEYIRDLSVIGVVESPNRSKKDILKYNQLVDENAKQLSIQTTIYCPISLDNFNLSEVPVKLFYWNIKNMDKYTEVIEKLSSYEMASSNRATFHQIDTKKTFIDNISDRLKSIRLLAYFIIVGLLVISGINTMSTMIFSIKERIKEIGIKKAMGANKIDIFVQFTMEGILLAFVSAVIAIILSLVVAFAIQYYCTNYLYILVKVNYSVSSIATTFSVAGIYGFVFSIIPSYYGAKIRVIKALRFE